jgi:hypothetical protein
MLFNGKWHPQTDSNIIYLKQSTSFKNITNECPPKI